MLCVRVCAVHGSCITTARCRLCRQAALLFLRCHQNLAVLLCCDGCCFSLTHTACCLCLCLCHPPRLQTGRVHLLPPPKQPPKRPTFFFLF